MHSNERKSFSIFAELCVIGYKFHADYSVITCFCLEISAFPQKFKTPDKKQSLLGITLTCDAPV